MKRSCLVFLLIVGCGRTSGVGRSIRAEKKIIGPCENVETVFGWVSICMNTEGEYSCSGDTGAVGN